MPFPCLKTDSTFVGFLIMHVYQYDIHALSEILQIIRPHKILTNFRMPAYTPRFYRFTERPHTNLRNIE